MGEDRKRELEKVFENIDGERQIVAPMIDDVVFLEQRLSQLRTMPFIRTKPDDPTRQKPTPAAKQYKELLQQYNNCIKILCGILRRNGVAEVSPLHVFIDSLNGGSSAEA